MTAGDSGSRARRAPRLAPDERLAKHISRRGRFLAHDPSQGRALPGPAKVLGAIGWAALVGYAFTCAVRGRGEGPPATS